MPAVKTRFAPSPTGYLHIGGARTALFAWAFARKMNGEFHLRIEDTDQARSDAKHSQAIISAMDWLGLQPDAAPVFQSANRERHLAAAQRLLQEGRAYHCYATPQELEKMREQQLARGDSPKYDRRWRDNPATPPKGIAPAIRLKMPTEGETVFQDAVKGELRVANSELDDYIIVRADGAPTYNLAAATDDIAMGITHIIRGDDHVMNTYRQWHLFSALGDAMPVFAHLPMIFSAVLNDNGQPATDAAGQPKYARMSKRHAAVDIAHYQTAGYLPDALCNYLARLSWSKGDAEVFTRDFFVQHFLFSAISQSPARFDLDKLNFLNRERLKDRAALPAAQLRQLAGIAATIPDAALDLLRDRADTLSDLRDEAEYFATRPTAPAAAVPSEHAPAFAALCRALADLPEWNAPAIKQCINHTAKAHTLKFPALGMPMRFLLTGRSNSPDIAAVAAIMGQQETLARLAAAPSLNTQQ